MPLYEFHCPKCDTVTETLIWRGESHKRSVACARCGSTNTTKLNSLASVKVARPAKYSDEFLDKAKPFLRTQRETAQYFADGKGSEDAKTFKLAEKIGERIDRTLAMQLPARKS